MKKLWKYVVVTIVMSLAFSFQVSAKDYITKENFDYEWYLEKHPDLAAVVDAANKDSIWDFYLNIGKPAGWSGRVAEEYLIKEYESWYKKLRLLFLFPKKNYKVNLMMLRLVKK